MSEEKKEKPERNCCGVGIWYSDGDATARALLSHACACVQASETGGMDPKSKVMTGYSGQHAG